MTRVRSACELRNTLRSDLMPKVEINDKKTLDIRVKGSRSHHRRQVQEMTAVIIIMTLVTVTD